MYDMVVNLTISRCEKTIRFATT